MHNCSVTVLLLLVLFSATTYAMCVAVERTYVSCLIQFRTFPFVYYKMCKYTLLWGFCCGSCACDSVRVRKRDTEWQRKWARQLMLQWWWRWQRWWYYRYPSFGIRFTCQCYLWFAIFKSNDYSLGTCRCQLGRERASTYCFLSLLQLDCPGSQRFMSRNLCTPTILTLNIERAEENQLSSWPQKVWQQTFMAWYAVIRIRTFAFSDAIFNLVEQIEHTASYWILTSSITSVFRLRKNFVPTSKTDDDA